MRTLGSWGAAAHRFCTSSTTGEQPEESGAIDLEDAHRCLPQGSEERGGCRYDRLRSEWWRFQQRLWPAITVRNRGLLDLAALGPSLSHYILYVF
jgi:hypothetical protein